MNTFEPQAGLVKESTPQPKVIAKLAIWQLLATLVLSLVLVVWFDQRVAVSALLGGLIAALTSFYMAGRLLTIKRLQRAQTTIHAPQLLGQFYSSVILKALFTLAMMGICIIFIKVSVAPFIIAYLVAAVIVNLFYLLVAKA